MNKVRMPLKSRGRECLRTANRSPPVAFSMESLPGWHPRSQHLRHLGPSLVWREMILIGLPQVCVPWGCFQNAGVIKKAWTLCTGPSSPYKDWRWRVTVSSAQEQFDDDDGLTLPPGPFLGRHPNAWPHPALAPLTTQLFTTIRWGCFSRCFLQTELLPPQLAKPFLTPLMNKELEHSKLDQR